MLHTVVPWKKRGFKIINWEQGKKRCSNHERGIVRRGFLILRTGVGLQWGFKMFGKIEQKI